MTSEQKFWVTQAALLAATLIALICSITVYYCIKTAAIAAAHDPVATACALDNDRGTSSLCTLKGAK